jgi:sugar phosphate isomerase/epimerase
MYVAAEVGGGEEKMIDRRGFLGAGLALPASALCGAAAPRYRTSLAAYSMRGFLDLKKPTMTLADFAAQSADWGFDGVELTEYYFPKPVTPEYVRALKRTCWRQGVDVTGTPMGNTFTHPPGEARDRELARVKAWIDVSADLGSPAIRIFAGNCPKGVEEAQARRWVVESIEDCLPQAEKRGVILALENHGGVVAKPEGLIEIVGALKSDWVGVNLDGGNFHGEDPYAELEACAPLAVTCQLKAEIRRAGGKPEEADYGRIIGILRKAGYRGYITLEYESAADPRTAIPAHLERIRPHLG